MRASLFLLVVSACGRIAFDPLTGSSNGDGGAGDDGASSGDAPPGTGVVVQQACGYDARSTATTMLSTTFGTALEPTDILFVAVGWNDAATTITGITDSGGDVFTPITALDRFGAMSQQIFIANTPTVMQNLTITVTFSQAVINSSLRACAFGDTDHATAPPNNKSGGTGNSFMSSPLTTLVPNSLVVASIAGTSNAGLDFSYITSINTMPLGHLVEHKVAGTPGSYRAGAMFGAASDFVFHLVALQPQ